MNDSHYYTPTRVGFVPGRALSAPARCLLAAALLLLTTGCPPPRNRQPIPAPITRAQALQRYNARVRAIPAFKANIAQWEVLLHDPQTGKQYHHSNLGGRIYYRPPADNTGLPAFYLRATAFPESEALVLGSNAREFWLYSKIAHRAWRGTFGPQSDTPSRQVPLNPQLLLGCIGLMPLPADPHGPIYPAFKVQPRHNVLFYLTPAAQGMLLQREIILDRRNDLPVKIIYYDPTGQVRLSTSLADYHPLGHTMLPGSIFILAPADGSYLKLKLDRFKIDHKDHPRLFRPPAWIPPDAVQPTLPLQ